jgi:hypothetical protein
MTRYFKVYVLPTLVMTGVATVVRSLSLDSFTYGVLAVVIIVGGMAWFIAAYRADQRRP